MYVDEARVRASTWGYQADLTTDLMVALGTNDVDGVRILSRDLRATTTRAGQALSRYFDFLPQLDKMDAARRHAAKSRDEQRP